jgi:mannose-1-phosphate guanylyltransferase
VYVVTEAGHAQHVKDQLPELSDAHFLIEPGRRGTGNCIVFALDVIARQHDRDEPIAFVHSDHHIRDIEGYARSLQKAAEASRTSHKVTLIGIEPTFPSTGFGYIERDSVVGETDAFTIQSFKEKPDFDTAKQYLQEGNYLWNCGYFVGSVNTFLSEIKAVAPALQATYDSLSSQETVPGEAYNQAYLALGDLVIDYELAEKSHNLAVVPANFDWMDIGSFKDLHDTVVQDEKGNHVQGDNIHAIDVENTYIRNETDTPVAVIGLDNVVVVNTPNGIVVARKDMSPRVGEIAKKIAAQKEGK